MTDADRLPDLARPYFLSKPREIHETLALSVSSLAQPADRPLNTLYWTPVGSRALARLKDDLAKNDFEHHQLPHAALAARLEYRLTHSYRLCTRESFGDAHTGPYAPRGFKPGTFAWTEDEASEVGTLREGVRRALRDWLLEDFTRLVNDRPAAEAALEHVRALHGEGALFDVLSGSIRLLPWVQDQNGTTAPAHRLGYTMLADFAARRLEGQEVFPGLGKLRRIVARERRTSSAELMTDPVPGRSFSLVLKLRIISLAGVGQPVLTIDVGKRRWTGQLKRPWRAGRVSGFALPQAQDRAVAFRFSLESVRGPEDGKRHYRPGGDYTALSRVFALPAGLSGADIAAGGATTGDCLVLIGHGAAHAPPHDIGAGVPEQDKQDAFDVVRCLLQPYGFEVWTPLERKRVSSNPYKQSGLVTALDKKLAQAGEKGDAEGVAACEQQRAETVTRNQQAVHQYLGEKPVLIVFVHESCGKEADLLADVVERSTGGLVSVNPVGLPPGTHGARRDLPLPDKADPVARGKARIQAWGATAERLAGYRETHNLVGCVVIAPDFYEAGRDDVINKNAARHALASKAGLLVQYLLPLESRKRDQEGDFRTRAENAWRDLAWNQRGRIDGAAERARHAFAPGTEPLCVIGIGVVKSNRVRLQKGSFVPVATKLDLRDDTCAIKFAYQHSRSGRVQFSEWLPLAAGCAALAHSTPMTIEVNLRRSAFQGLCLDAVNGACDAGERPVVLINSTHGSGLWGWLTDRGIDGERLDLDAVNGGDAYHLRWKDARIVRVREENAPQLLVRKTRAASDEHGRQVGTLSVPTTPNPGLYRVANDARLPTYWTVGGNLGRKTKKGASCYRPRLLAKPGKTDVGGRDAYFLGERGPDLEQWPTPKPVELVLALLREGDDADRVAGFVESLRYGYGHFHERTKLPAPLSFEKVVREYTLPFGEEDVEADLEENDGTG